MMLNSFLTILIMALLASCQKPVKINITENRWHLYELSLTNAKGDTIDFLKMGEIRKDRSFETLDKGAFVSDISYYIFKHDGGKEFTEYSERIPANAKFLVYLTDLFDENTNYFDFGNNGDLLVRYAEFEEGSPYQLNDLKLKWEQKNKKVNIVGIWNYPDEKPMTIDFEGTVKKFTQEEMIIENEIQDGVYHLFFRKHDTKNPKDKSSSVEELDNNLKKQEYSAETGSWKNSQGYTLIITRSGNNIYHVKRLYPEGDTPLGVGAQDDIGDAVFINNRYEITIRGTKLYITKNGNCLVFERDNYCK